MGYGEMSVEQLQSLEKGFQKDAMYYLSHDDKISAIYALSARADVLAEQIRRLTDETD